MSTAKATTYIAIAILATLLAATLTQAKMISIARNAVRMRSGPSLRNKIQWELFKGYPLQVLKRKGYWLKVKDFEQDSGWVHRSLVSNKPHVIVKKKLINIRSGPGTEYTIVGRAKYGVVFQTVKRIKKWIKVRHDEGLTGWIYRPLVWGW